MQLASVAGSDPFVKIRGLIEDMIAKLLKEAQAAATEIRTKEKADNTAAISDFSQSAEAVVKAMGVLKSFYEGALIQTSAKVASKRPSFGGAKTDTGSSIISVLEVAESDFTTLLAETETA